MSIDCQASASALEANEATLNATAAFEAYTVAQLKSNFNVSRSGSSSACWISSSLNVSSSRMSVTPSHTTRWADHCPTSKPSAALFLRYWSVIGSRGWRGLLHTRHAVIPRQYERMAESEARLVTLNEPGGGGVLIIRVWREAGVSEGFRARIIFGAGEDPATEATFVIARDPAEVIKVVQRWL